MRGWSTVPRTRTDSGGWEWIRALVTSSETPSWAASTRSSRPISSRILDTQDRASFTEGGLAGRTSERFVRGTVPRSCGTESGSGGGGDTPAFSKRLGEWDPFGTHVRSIQSTSFNKAFSTTSAIDGWIQY